MTQVLWHTTVSIKNCYGRYSGRWTFRGKRKQHPTAWLIDTVESNLLSLRKVYLPATTITVFDTDWVRRGGWEDGGLVACDKIQNCPTLLIRSWESLIEQFNTFRHEKSINTQKWDFNPHFQANVALKIYIFWRIYIIKKNKSLYTYIQVLVFFISLG